MPIYDYHIVLYQFSMQDLGIYWQFKNIDYFGLLIVGKQYQKFVLIFGYYYLVFIKELIDDWRLQRGGSHVGAAPPSIPHRASAAHFGSCSICEGRLRLLRWWQRRRIPLVV